MTDINQLPNKRTACWIGFRLGLERCGWIVCLPVLLPLGKARKLWPRWPAPFDSLKVNNES